MDRYRPKNRSGTVSWDWKSWESYVQTVEPLSHHTLVPLQPDPSLVSPSVDRAPLVPSFLDLHGMTLTEAFHTLCYIIEPAAHHHRRLLVITGIGGASLKGALRRELPFWVQNPRISPWVRSCVQAPTHLGGKGAFILELRQAPLRDDVFKKHRDV